MIPNSYIQPLVVNVRHFDGRLESYDKMMMVINNEWYIAPYSIQEPRMRMEKDLKKPLHEGDDVTNFSWWVGDGNGWNLTHYNQDVGISATRMTTPGYHQCGFPAVGRLSSISKGERLKCINMRCSQRTLSFANNQFMMNGTNFELYQIETTVVDMKKGPKSQILIETDCDKTHLIEGALLFDDNNRAVGMYIDTFNTDPRDRKAVFISFESILPAIVDKVSQFDYKMPKNESTEYEGGRRGFSMMSMRGRIKERQYKGIHDDSFYYCPGCGARTGPFDDSIRWVYRCPRCGSTWKDNNDNCADCGVAMVSSLYCDTPGCRRRGKELVYKSKR